MWMITSCGTLPYCGPACDKAGIKLGMVYKKRADAVKDLLVLSKYSKLELFVAKYRYSTKL